MHHCRFKARFVRLFDFDLHGKAAALKPSLPFFASFGHLDRITNPVEQPAHQVDFSR
jgi:hypothetical protein